MGREGGSIRQSLSPAPVGASFKARAFGGRRVGRPFAEGLRSAASLVKLLFLLFVDGGTVARDEAEEPLEVGEGLWEKEEAGGGGACAAPVACAGPVPPPGVAPPLAGSSRFEGRSGSVWRLLKSYGLWSPWPRPGGCMML